MRAASAALTKPIEIASVKKLQQQVDMNSELINHLVDKLVGQYCKLLDDYMLEIKTILEDFDHPPNALELDDFVMKLPVLLYFTGEAQEAIGVKEDVAKAIKTEAYSEVYNATAGTVGDKVAAAELASQNEFIAHITYQRAYKKVKLRMEIANEALQSIKKVISRRMSETELSKVDDGRISENYGKRK